ncbi:hypothetical protein D3C84_664230 [compost metagenome]
MILFSQSFQVHHQYFYCEFSQPQAVHGNNQYRYENGVTNETLCKQSVLQQNSRLYKL